MKKVDVKVSIKTEDDEVVRRQMNTLSVQEVDVAINGDESQETENIVDELLELLNIGGKTEEQLHDSFMSIALRNKDDYFCASQGKKYHRRRCEGLKAPDSMIEYRTRTYWESHGKSLCKICKSLYKL